MIIDPGSLSSYFEIFAITNLSFSGSHTFREFLEKDILNSFFYSIRGKSIVDKLNSESFLFQAGLNEHFAANQIEPTNADKLLQNSVEQKLKEVFTKVDLVKKVQVKKLEDSCSNYRPLFVLCSLHCFVFLIIFAFKDCFFRHDQAAFAHILSIALVLLGFIIFSISYFVKLTRYFFQTALAYLGWLYLLYISYNWLYPFFCHNQTSPFLSGLMGSTIFLAPVFALILYFMDSYQRAVRVRWEIVNLHNNNIKMVVNEVVTIKTILGSQFPDPNFTIFGRADKLLFTFTGKFTKDYSPPPLDSAE